MIKEREQWLRSRLEGIGGSEAGIVLGVSPFKSRLELWNEKINKEIKMDLEDELIFKIGNALEPIVANEYFKMTGRVLELRSQKVHPEYSFITGNVDREIIKSERMLPGILEIKTKGAWTTWHGDEIPLYIQAQLQQYLAVYGYTWGSIAVLDLGTRTVNYTDFERDEELIKTIIEEEKKFWKLVQDKTPPKIDESKACSSFLKEFYNTSEPITIDISDNEEATKYAIALQQVKRQYKDLEIMELESKNYFMDLMKNAEKAVGDGFNITWKSDKDSVKFDEERFKNENSELYKKYMKEKKGVRRFLTRFNKEKEE